MQKNSWRGGTLKLAVLAGLFLGGSQGSPPQESLDRVESQAAIPADLYETYERLVRAMESGDEEAIEGHLLPAVTEVNREERDPKHLQYGTDINLPFIASNFNRDIRSFRQHSKDTFLLRTLTTSFFFVRTANEGWKVYLYVDKPLM